MLYNGGLKDWMKAGNDITTTAPLPIVDVNFMDVGTLQKLLAAADEQNCKDTDNLPLVTILDFRMSRALQVKMSADKYQIQTKCRTITAQLDDFIDNQDLIDSLPENGQIIAVSETGNRDRFLIRFLSLYNKTNIQGLKYGMRNWLKAGYPVEIIPQGFLTN
jgi:rhodanese-related sulfurtransferase